MALVSNGPLRFGNDLHGQKFCIFLLCLKRDGKKFVFSLVENCRQFNRILLLVFFNKFSFPLHCRVEPNIGIPSTWKFNITKSFRKNISSWLVGVQLLNEFEQQKSEGKKAINKIE